jgi:hypothetical protein
MKITLLNTSILTDYGSYRYEHISLEEAKRLLHDGHSTWESAIGHQSTADMLTELLGIECPVNRIQYRQGLDQAALVFKLKGRPEEGKILNRKEIEKIGYEFGILVKTA